MLARTRSEEGLAWLGPRVPGRGSLSRGLIREVCSVFTASMVPLRAGICCHMPQRAGALCDQPRSMMSATPARTQRAGGDFVLSCAWKT